GAIRFAELRAVWAPNERMMQVQRRGGATKQSRETNLTTGAREEILTTNDNIHTLCDVIDDDRKLIPPAAGAIAHKHIAALLRRILFLRTERYIDELLAARVDANTARGRRIKGDATLAARARVSRFCSTQRCAVSNIASRANARVVLERRE